MRARIGVCQERWDGVPLLVAHVIPLDTEDAMADDAARLLGAPRPYDGETYPTLCGERCRPHFVRGTSRGYTVPLRWRSCPACAMLDSVPRLP